jgi:hypothetical protein
MQKCHHSFFILLAAILAIPALADVSVSSPPNGGTMSSPVPYAASGTSSTCNKGVASMGVYVNEKLVYVQQGDSLNTNLTMDVGKYNTVVEEWDYCGGATYTPVALTVTNKTGVWVNAPANNSQVSSPVNYVATATTSTCSKGVASMGIYVDKQLEYVVNGDILNTNLNLNAGNYNTVVEEWDYCGGAAYTPIAITVTGGGGGGGGGNKLSNLQASKGWVGYGELPPEYNICSYPCPGVTWSMKQGIKDPSMDGDATEYNIGGTKPYADVLWTNPLIGQGSTQGLPDSNHTLLPKLHDFTYDTYFYGTNLGASEALEFDISMYFDGLSLIWGHQCVIAGGNVWEIWDNVSSKWVSTGIPCYPNENEWNHVTLQVQRESDNTLLFESITFNGKKSVLNKYYAPGSAPQNWWGITVNYQTDGNYKQEAYTTYVDEFSFTYE